MQHPVLVDAYIQFEGVKGCCSDDKHSGWTELVSWNHAVHQAAAESASSAIGHGMGKSEHEDYWVEAPIDASFAKLFELASSGAYVKNAKDLDVAAQQKDKRAAMAAQAKLAGSCKACHSAHRG